MDRNKLRGIIRSIGLALNTSNNTVTTDSLDAVPVDDYSWRIDNSKEIELLKELEILLFNRSDICS